MEKLNKLSLPATILLASIILGGFYYASEVGKQNSIERQQMNNLLQERRMQEAEKEALGNERLGKVFCVDEAQQNAIELNKGACDRGEYCLKGEGMYLVAQYESSYSRCLQRKGLE